MYKQEETLKNHKTGHQYITIEIHVKACKEWERLQQSKENCFTENRETELSKKY
jgi:hypothetical protein